MIDVRSNLPYRRLPYINFFQYPPMKPIKSGKSTSFSKKLALAKKNEESLFAIFISIPYCQSRCNSCAYFKNLLPSFGNIYKILNDYVSCLCIQMQKYASSARFSSAQCGAVYIGGGTASLLTSDQVGRIIANLKKIFNLNSDTEITLEGNPHQLTVKYLKSIKESGVNRVSIGYQSCNDGVLKILGCAHNAAEAVQAVENANVNGFKTINLDLLYRVPGQTYKQWIEDLNKAIRLHPPGITIYEYVVHQNSKTKQLISKSLLAKPVDKEEVQKWYIRARSLLQKNGYIEHRKGSFAKHGHTQQYGALSYDRGCEIIGLGAGAYSFINGYQFQASNDPEIFKRQIKNGLYAIGDKISVKTTRQNLMERFIIFNFFSSQLNRLSFLTRFGKDPLLIFPEKFNRLNKYGLIKITKNKVKLTNLGVMWRNGVFYEFCSEKFKFTTITN